LKRPPRSRWTSFVADPREERPRVLFEQDNGDHRLRVEHNRDTLLVHLSDEDGSGWTVSPRAGVACPRLSFPTTQVAGIVA
jgi:hypothetical protein